MWRIAYPSICIAFCGQTRVSYISQTIHETGCVYICSSNKTKLCFLCLKYKNTNVCNARFVQQFICGRYLHTQFARLSVWGSICGFMWRRVLFALDKKRIQVEPSRTLTQRGSYRNAIRNQTSLSAVTSCVVRNRCCCEIHPPSNQHKKKNQSIKNISIMVHSCMRCRFHAWSNIVLNYTFCLYSATARSYLDRLLEPHDRDLHVLCAWVHNF